MFIPDSWYPITNLDNFNYYENEKSVKLLRAKFVKPKSINQVKRYQ